MRRLGVSRRQLFESVERAALASLPSEDYEFAEWRLARVSTDYHVESRSSITSICVALITFIEETHQCSSIPPSTCCANSAFMAWPPPSRNSTRNQKHAASSMASGLPCCSSAKLLRRQKRLEARARAAKLRHDAQIENADFRAARGLDRNLFMALAGCDWNPEAPQPSHHRASRSHDIMHTSLCYLKKLDLLIL